jgi:acyl-CoA thioesterase
MDLDAAGKPVAHRMLVDDPASAWMGIEVLEVRDGHATIQMSLRQDMLNGFGIAHGGMIFALGDTAFALACNDPDGDGSTITVAAGADINFIRSAHLGQRLTAVANRLSNAGRSGLYDIQITTLSPDGRRDILAEFRGRSRTIAGPGAARPPNPPTAPTP